MKPLTKQETTDAFADGFVKGSKKVNGGGGGGSPLGGSNLEG